MEEAVQPQGQDHTLEVIKYGMGGIVLLGGSAFLIRYFIKRSFENSEQNKSLDEGAAATYAKQLKMAFENDGYPGTNMKEVRRIFQEIPSKKAFEQVESSYQKQFASPLAKDLQSELKSSEYQEMVSIKAAKQEKGKVSQKEKAQLDQIRPLQWAKRFKAAFDYTYGPFPASDTDAIEALLYEIPTQKSFADTGAVYQKLYHKKLMDDLKSEVRFYAFPKYVDIIKKKPK